MKLKFSRSRSLVAASAVTLAAVSAIALTSGTATAATGALERSTLLPAPELAYVTGTGANDQVWVKPLTGGGAAKRLGPGDGDLISPDGSTVAVFRIQPKGYTALELVSTVGKKPRELYHSTHVQATALAWSPDARYLAIDLTGTGSSIHSYLDVLDTQTLKVRRVTAGTVCGVSFSPGGSDQLVYGVSGGFCLLDPSDIYVASIGKGAGKRITHGGHSLFPLWGPAGIVFDKWVWRGKNKAPAEELYTMSASGSGQRQLTHVSVPPLQDGIEPVAFSADGTKLLGRFTGEDTNFAWAVSLPSGKATELKVKGHEVVPDGISQDGASVLVDDGAFENPPSSHGTIETVPFEGGPPTVLVHRAAQGSWNA